MQLFRYEHALKLFLFLAWALHRTPLGELQCSPRPPSWLPSQCIQCLGCQPVFKYDHLATPAVAKSKILRDAVPVSTELNDLPCISAACTEHSERTNTICCCEFNHYTINHVCAYYTKKLQNDFNKQENPENWQYKTGSNLINTGVAPKTKLAINSFMTRFFPSHFVPNSCQKHNVH